MKKRRTLIRIFLLAPMIILLVYISAMLIMNSLNDYRSTTRTLKHFNEQSLPPSANKNYYSALSWNIGYGGLGAGADFFYDGGSMVRPEKDEYEGYWIGLQEQIGTLDSIDFILLQEVDIDSRRSYGTNQFNKICELLPAYVGVRAINYDALFVPVPVFKPLGRVESVLALFSKYMPESSVQEGFPLNYWWPKSLFMPDRCFVHSSIPLVSGKRLHIINTHNSAYDDGSLRDTQLNILFDYMKELYAKGDYVVAGGDWNLNPPGFTNDPFVSGDFAFSLDYVTDIFAENKGWGIYYDPACPTNRDVSSAYKKGQTPTTIIDFYVCSPNISKLKIKTFDTAFSNSDHQPVYFQFYLN